MREGRVVLCPPTRGEGLVILAHVTMALAKCCIHGTICKLDIEAEAANPASHSIIRQFNAL